MKAYGQITLSVVNDGAPGIPGTPALNIVISNESQSIPCASNGLVSKQILLEIPFCGYEGFNKVACDVSVGNLPSGMTQVTENATPDKDGKIILNVSKNASLGGADILNGKVPLSFTLKGKTITKQFVWSKVKDGSAGSSARIYTVHPSTLIVKKLPGDKFSPETLTFSATYKDGNSTTSNAYSGRFIIERSTNGVTFNSIYTSNQDESSATYTMQKNDTAIRCKLCASGGITKELDFQTVTVLNDGSISTTGGINLAIGTNQGDRNWDWDMQTGDYTTEALTIDGINCAKLVRGTQEQTGRSYIRYKKTALNKIKTNEDYILSFECRTNKDTTMNARFTDGDGSHNILESTSPSNLSLKKDVWNKCVFNWRTKKTFTVNDNIFIYLGEMDSSPNAYYTFRNLQLERGTIATDWKPAPEDMNDSLSSLHTTIMSEVGVKVDALNKLIEGKVSQETFTTYTGETGETIKGLQSKQTEFEASLSGIRTEVSDVQSTLDTKADGSKVQILEENVSKLEQSSEQFKSTVEKTYLKKSELGEELKKNATFAISLTNDDHTIPTDQQGNNGNYNGCETTASAVFGSENVTENCVFTQSVSAGVTGSWNNDTHTYTVTNMTTDTGYVDITGKYTVSISGKEEIKIDTKRFVLSKRKDAETTIVYSLQSSDTIVKKLTENTFDPKTITFSSFYRDGNNSSQRKFNGAFQILESINGGAFTEKYFSEVKQSEVVYTPNTKNLTKIQCILYKELDKIDELDRYTINVISDQTVDIGCRNLIRNSKTMLFDKYGFVNEPKHTYTTDENGNILTDENGNRFIY